MADGQIYVATESGACEVKEGEEYIFVKGVTRVREGHPLLKKVGDYFEPIDAHYELEEATDKKRTSRRSSKPQKTRTPADSKKASKPADRSKEPEKPAGLTSESVKGE